MGNCKSEDRQITLEIPSVGLEIAPTSVDFRQSRGKYDHFRANFHADIGRHIQDEVIHDDGILNTYRKAYIKMEGDRVHPALWRPDSLIAGNDTTGIELFDARKHLETVNVNLQYQNTTVREVINDIWEQYQEGANNPFHTQLRFTIEDVPDRPKRENTGAVAANAGNPIGAAVAKTIFGEEQVVREHEDQEIISNTRPDRWIESYRDNTSTSLEDGVAILRDTYDRTLTNLPYTESEVDYEDISALAAMEDITSRVGQEFWTVNSDDGIEEVELQVGQYEVTSQLHYAAGTNVASSPNFTGSVFRVGDFELREGGRPIKKVIVKGNKFTKWDRAHYGMEPWSIEERFTKTGADVANIGRFLDPTSDYYDKVDIGYCERDIPGGQTKVFNVDAPKYALPELARHKMRQLLQYQSSGQIEILPANSGKDFSDYRFIRVGDVIQTTVPDGERCKKWSSLYENDFIISGFSHSMNDGFWSLNLTVIDRIPAEEIPPADKASVSTDMDLKEANFE